MQLLFKANRISTQEQDTYIFNDKHRSSVFYTKRCDSHPCVTNRTVDSASTNLPPHCKYPLVTKLELDQLENSFMSWSYFMY